MEQCLLQDKGMPTKFCGEAIYCSKYLVNMILTYFVWDVTPIEKINGRKLLVGHLKMFIYIVWSQILCVKRKKLDGKSHSCIMVGYSNELKGYNQFYLIKKEVICRMDVIFG